AERLAACVILGRKTVWDRGEPFVGVPGYRALHKSEITAITGIGYSSQQALARKQAELRKTRSLRRLADSQWKVAVAAESAGRKERERERHLRATELRNHG